MKGRDVRRVREGQGETERERSRRDVRKEFEDVRGEGEVE